MDDNVVLVGFTEQCKAYQALSTLRQAGDAGQVEVRSAALLHSADPTASCGCPKAMTPPPAPPSRAVA